MFDIEESSNFSKGRARSEFVESERNTTSCDIFGVAGGAVLGTVGAAYLGNRAAGKAADAQSRAAQAGVDSNERVAQMQIQAQKDAYREQQEYQKPFRDIGLDAQKQLSLMLRSRYAQDFGMRDFQEDPGYAFRMSEGMKAMDRNAAARGGLISGNALKAAQRYGQEMGSQEYQNAFNRYQVNRSNQIQPLQSLAGLGQSATNSMTTAAGQMGAGISGAYGQLGSGNANAFGDMGNARASGYVGATNAITGGIGNYLNYKQGQDMVNALRPKPGSGDASWNYTEV